MMDPCTALLHCHFRISRPHALCHGWVGGGVPLDGPAHPIYTRTEYGRVPPTALKHASRAHAHLKPLPHCCSTLLQPPSSEAPVAPRPRHHPSANSGHAGATLLQIRCRTVFLPDQPRPDVEVARPYPSQLE